MNTAALRRLIEAARTDAEKEMERAEREGKPMTRDKMRGAVIAYGKVLAWMESEGEM